MKTAMDIKNAHDQDLFVKMVSADAGHQQRSRAKALRVEADRLKAQAEANHELAAKYTVITMIGCFVALVACVLTMV